MACGVLRCSLSVGRAGGRGCSQCWALGGQVVAVLEVEVGGGKRGKRVLGAALETSRLPRERLMLPNRRLGGLAVIAKGALSMCKA